MPGGVGGVAPRGVPLSRSSVRLGRPHASRRRTGFHLWTPPFRQGKTLGSVARGRMLSSVRPLMRQEDSRRPVWEFADRVQITRSVLEAFLRANRNDDDMRVRETRPPRCYFYNRVVTWDQRTNIM